MPDIETPKPKTPRLRAPDPKDVEHLTPFEAVMVQQMGALHEALLDEFKGLRTDLSRYILGAGGGVLLVVLFLIAGILLVRGEDPAAAAKAVTVMVPVEEE